MDFVEQVKTAVDIVSVVGEYVRLRKATSSRYTGLCPFHTEKTASFSVNAAHQYFYCFGCHAKGDVFNFLMQIEGLTFFESLKLLSERYGIPMPQRREFSDAESRHRDALQRLHALAQEHFVRALAGPSGAEARAYLVKRGLTAGAITEFGLGYADRSGSSLVRLFERENFTAAEIETSGLVLKRDSGGHFDRFRDRLMFPIHNEAGRVIAFGGRALAAGDEPKYLNSPETDIYKKSNVLYNLHRAKAAIRKQERAVLVEGYMDVIGVYSAGITEVVASCGTALTNLQVRAVKRHTEKIVVNFDPDAAGSNAAERSIQLLLDEGMHVRILELDGDLDPDEYIRHNGVDVYRGRLEKAAGYFLWLAQRARTRFDMHTAEGRMEGFKWLLPVIRRISDKIERAAVADEVAEYLGVERTLILDEFRRGAPSRQKEIQVSPLSQVPKAERILLRSVVTEPSVRQVLLTRVRDLQVVTRFKTHKILEAVWKLYDSQPDFSFAELEGRLEEQDRRLLAEAVFADNSGEELFTQDQAVSYLRVLEKEEKQAGVTELQSRLREAQRDGDLQTAIGLAEQIDTLKKALRQ
jgi:DNA primase